MNPLLEKFCRYVRIESTARENSGSYPSSPGQLEMGRLLCDELRQLGLADAAISEHGIVTATIPATTKGAATIAWFAHVDTSPEFTAHNVQPIVHQNYDGRDIVLPGHTGRVIRPPECPELAEVKGKTLITSDGTTLLGADDKCGVAVIMEAARRLIADPGVPHGDIRICFTCDEEIGHGVDHVDLAGIGAVAGYTLDGEGQGRIEAETFSADLAVVTIDGVNIHPAMGKDRMVNAVRIAAAFIEQLPQDRLSPETTAGREGFVHPYVIEGGVAQARIRILLRDFITARLAGQRALLEEIAARLRARYPRAGIELKVTEQYRNMAEGLQREPRAVALAERAMRSVGLEPVHHSIRGGTDGSRLTAMGLPTPNLSTGMHNFHSPLEWACLEEMENAVRVLIELAREWSRERAA